MKPLTEPQEKVLSFISSYIEDEGFSPTSKEIADNFGWYPNGADCHVQALVRKGAITRVKGKMRSIRVTEEFEG